MLVNWLEGRYSNGLLTVVTLGLDAFMASVFIVDNKGQELGVNYLIPGFNPYAKRRSSENFKTQDEQITTGAQTLKNHGQDILKGDLERFDRIFQEFYGMKVTDQFKHPEKTRFSTPQVNTIASDEGFSVQVLGMVGLQYKQDGKTLHINSEVLLPHKIMVVFSDIEKWDSGELIDEKTKMEIIENVREAFAWRGTSVEPR